MLSPRHFIATLGTDDGADVGHIEDNGPEEPDTA